MMLPKNKTRAEFHADFIRSAVFRIVNHNYTRLENFNLAQDIKKHADRLLEVCRLDLNDKTN